MTSGNMPPSRAAEHERPIEVLMLECDQDLVSHINRELA
jgi:hypothetical protein